MPNISKTEIGKAVQVLKACLHHPDADDAIAMLQGLLDQPVATHPAPITADDVTDEMVDAYIRQRHSFKDHEVVIAAAVNAYLGSKK